MSANCNPRKLQLSAFYPEPVHKILAQATLVVALFCCSTIFAQRIVLPGQDLLAPYLNDPSYIGLKNGVTATGVLQLSDYERKQHTQYVNVQIPVSEGLSFGADYFKDALEFYNYSTAMASAAIKFNMGGDESYIRLGFSGGVDAKRQDRIPVEEIPNMEQFVPRINESDLSFTYRAGIHYTWNDLTIGGSYNRLPIQSTLARANQEDLFGYWIEEGFIGHLRYGFDISETFRLTPVFRYLSYANDPVYEGALLADVGNWASASVSYKNDYSVNPAIRFEFFNALQVGYSYEMSIGDVDFEDVHSLSIAYKIGGDDAVESEWVQTAKENNRKIDAIKPKKPKKDKEPEPTPAIEEEAAPEVTEKELPVVVDNVQVGTIKNGLMLNSGFYIIVGTFETMEKAEAERTRLKNMDYYTAIGKQEGDDKFYLYIDSDTDRTNAQKRLRAHRLDRNFKNAYLLEVD